MTDFTGRESPSKTLTKLMVFLPVAPPSSTSYQAGITPPGFTPPTNAGIDGSTTIINGVEVRSVTYPGGTYFW